MRWFLERLGWIVTGLGVAAITGIMQRNPPDQGPQTGVKKPLTSADK
jgi:hypothetical protein